MENNCHLLVILQMSPMTYSSVVKSQNNRKSNENYSPKRREFFAHFFIFFCIALTQEIYLRARACVCVSEYKNNLGPSAISLIESERGCWLEDQNPFKVLQGNTQMPSSSKVDFVWDYGETDPVNTSTIKNVLRTPPIPTLEANNNTVSSTTTTTTTTTTEQRQNDDRTVDDWQELADNIIKEELPSPTPNSTNTHDSPDPESTN
jgi:hypothetical protein